MVDLLTPENGIMVAVVSLLVWMIKRNERRCKENETRSREDAKLCHDKIEGMLQQMLKDSIATAKQQLESAARQETLMHAVKTSFEHSAKAVADISSGHYTAITKRKRR